MNKVFYKLEKLIRTNLRICHFSEWHNNNIVLVSSLIWGEMLHWHYSHHAMFLSESVVSRWRDPQLQVSENYSDLTKWKSTVFKYCWSHFIFNMFKMWYLTLWTRCTDISVFLWRHIPKYRYIGMKLTISGLDIVQCIKFKNTIKHKI